jgi:hypothetical protein
MLWSIRLSETASFTNNCPGEGVGLVTWLWPLLVAAALLLMLCGLLVFFLIWRRRSSEYSSKTDELSIEPGASLMEGEKDLGYAHEYWNPLDDDSQLTDIGSDVPDAEVDDWAATDGSESAIGDALSGSAWELDSSKAADSTFSDWEDDNEDLSMADFEDGLERNCSGEPSDEDGLVDNDLVFQDQLGVDE